MICCLAALLAGAMPGCTRKKAAVSAGQEEAAKVDVAADLVAARAGYPVALARDPQPLVTLAEGSAGWASYFDGDAAGALLAFEGGLTGAAPDSAVRTGAARAALDVAYAHASLAEIVYEVAPKLLAAQALRPNAEETAAWRAYVEARLALLRGQPAAAVLAKIPAESPAAPWAAALAADVQTPTAALLRGEAAGLDAPLPDGATATYGQRLGLRAMVAAGQLKEAASLFSRIDPTQPDFRFESASLRDPAVADGGKRLFAARALAALEGATGWAPLWRARALGLLGRPADAAAELATLLAKPPQEAPLADVVLSGALGAADLAAEAAAERVLALHAAGDDAAARALYATLPVDTIARRTLKTWAGTQLGEELDADAFPGDRAVLTRVITDEIAALGAAATGVEDVTALALADRYTDEVQRRFAEALAFGGQPALAMKTFAGAEDKAHAFTPSARNSVRALCRAALESLRIGRPRVSNKYLSRLDDRLPGAAAPSEMLADLLTIRAMEQEGAAATGQ